MMPSSRTAALVLGLVVVLAGGGLGRQEGGGRGGEGANPPRKLVPIDLVLPRPAFKGTPKHVPPGARLEKPRGRPRPPFLAPKGTRNVARGRPVLASDRDPIIGDAAMVTDGDKEAREGSYVELGPGTQYVQIDLGGRFTLRAVVLWHYHRNARVYHDVVVQVSDDPSFAGGGRTLFNNDRDNSSGLGAGKDLEYWETYEGKLVDAGGAAGRYVRCYSRGSTADDQNHYTEVEVFASPIAGEGKRGAGAPRR